MATPTAPVDGDVDAHFMRRAVANASAARVVSPPNPWVGAVLVAADGETFDGATEKHGSRHAERVALDAAGAAARGATMYTTLEPCSFVSRTGACSTALVEAGVARVVYAVADPDARVSGDGHRELTDAAIQVATGIEAALVEEQLRPYLVQRRTGRPYVVLKLAATLDGRLAAPDGTSTWITGAQARADVHRLRAQSGAIVVGSSTVRQDNPSLTVRDFTAPAPTGEVDLNPVRIVLGEAPGDASVHPAQSYTGDLGELLDQLGADGILQLMVEGGAAVDGAFHRAGLIDEYVIYLAPALLGGDDGVPLFRGPGAPTMADITRGRFVSVDRLGDDVRLVYRPTRP